MVIAVSPEYAGPMPSTPSLQSYASPGGRPTGPSTLTWPHTVSGTNPIIVFTANLYQTATGTFHLRGMPETARVASGM